MDARATKSYNELLQCVTHPTVKRQSEAAAPHTRSFTFLSPVNASEWDINLVMKGERPWRGAPLAERGAQISNIDTLLELSNKHQRLKNEVARAEEEVQLVKQDMDSTLMWFATQQVALEGAIRSCHESSSLQPHEKQGLDMLFTRRLERMKLLGQKARAAFDVIVRGADTEMPMAQESDGEYSGSTSDSESEGSSGDDDT